MELSQSANQVPLAQSRLPEIDMLRGFALLGIAVENIFAIHTPNIAFAEYAAQYPSGLNHWLIWGLMVLVRGKFYPIFAMVFGMAAAYSLPKYGTAYFVRRQGGLFLLGLLQVLFVWNGDVLIQYALMGLLLLGCRTLHVRWLYALCAGLFLFSFLGEGLWPVTFHQASPNAAKYLSGSFLEAVEPRVREYVLNIFTWQAVLFYAKIFAFMLLGYALVKTDLVKRLVLPSVILRAFGYHALLVIGIGALFVATDWRQEEKVPTWGEGVKTFLLAWYFYGFVACYALLPFLWKKLFSSLQWLGQLTLTHYLLQNLVFCYLMLGYGMGYAGKLQPWQLVSIYIVLLAVQWILSKPLLQKFKIGPAEALLRNMAGKK